LSIRVAVSGTHRHDGPDQRVAGVYVRRVLKQEGRTDATISLVFVGSRMIRRLNRRFLRHDYVTDVLAFPLGDGEELEGEIYVNVDRAKSQAASFGVSPAEEIGRLIIHGTLHLAGYDDGNPRAARRMKEAEDLHVRHWFEK
jgi:rRNA maturation RNase YbeY